MPHPSPSRSRRARGQSLVELALILPVMLLLLLTAIDLGRILYSQIAITNAAKEGALVAAQGGTFQNGQGCSDTNTVMCGVLTEAKGGFVEVDRALVTLSPLVCEKNAMYPSTGSPPRVSVSVRAPFRVLTPIIGDVIGLNLVLTSTADAQCLVVPRVTFPSAPAPVAAFTATTSGSGLLTVNVDASASSSSGATITDYLWSFGATTKIASKTYSAPGAQTITLTITNNLGRQATTSQVVVVACPTVSFTATGHPTKSKPHRMDLDATLTSSTTGWSWVWSGAITGNKQNLDDKDFPRSGSQDVTVTATKGACVVSTTQAVVAP